MYSFHEQHSFDTHPSAMGAAVTEYPCILPQDDAIDWFTNPSQIIPDNTPFHENALGLYGMYGHESVWSTDQFACPTATSVQNHWKNDTNFLSPPFLHQPASPDTAMHFEQPLVPYHVPVRAETTATRLWGNAIPHPIQEGYPIPKPISCLPGRHIAASRLLTRSTATGLRHKPYPLGPDSTKQATVSASLYRCQWFDGASLCGAVVAGNKHAIGRHLHVAHAIQLKADKTDQVCLWDGCQKWMRRESMSRHILAVHMGDKVHCPRCGSQFARPDSLQRHQRTCLAKEEDAPDACRDELLFCRHGDFF